MNDSIFRKKSIDRIASPEQIDDYMKVTSPSMWIILGVIVFLLLAMLVWSVTGRIEDNINAEEQMSVKEIAPIELLF